MQSKPSKWTAGASLLEIPMHNLERRRKYMVTCCVSGFVVGSRRA